MALNDWIERLRDGYAGTAVRDVRGAASLAAASEQPEALAADAVFVAPASETARDGDGGPQVVVREMLVVAALRDPSDALGADGMTELERVVAATHAALIGWRPPDAAALVVYRRGQLLRFERRSVWWQMMFAVPLLVRGQGG